MRNVIIAGYLASALLYLAAWVNPRGGIRRGLVDWVSFTKLALAEFLSLHAATLLSALVLATRLGESDQDLRLFFWAVFAFYALLAIGAYLFHRSHRALVGFYLLLVVRGADFLSLRSPEADVMRAEVVKNFMMSVPMMFLIAIISMSDDGLTPWQEAFGNADTLWRRIWRGRPLIAVAAYYALWAFVELKFPERLSDK